MHKSANILIADDDPNILRIAASLLRARGYTVLTAPDGEAALEVFARAPHAIQLVISDVMMPRMRGPQLVRSISRLSPSTASLLTSGTWTREDGVPFIQKPFTFQKLLTTVRALLAACDFVKIEREQALARSRRVAAILNAQEHEPVTAE